MELKEERCLALRGMLLVFFSFSTLGCLLLIRTYWMRKIKWFDIKMGQQLPAHMHQYELVLFIYV